MQAVRRCLETYRKDGQDRAAEALKARYTYRMYDVSEFVKTLKQRFTQGFNRRHNRKGTLWEERFKSVLIESPSGRIADALSTVAAYIDLNAVRAGIVRDPARYRFCGYGQAVAGNRRARRGLRIVMRGLGQDGAWRLTSAAYRKLLYVTGEESGVNETGTAAQPGFTAEEVKRTLDAGGELPVQQVLRCRVRYFTDGLVLGSRPYVEDIFSRHRSHFSAKRKSLARPMKGFAGAELFTARRLRLDVFGLPAGG